jgi:F420-dependent oxidoreductase-like protein
MRIGIFGGDLGPAGVPVDGIVADARKAADEGFASYWLPQIFGYDAITVLSMVGREVDGIELGTAVVPTYPRHPMMLAAQALTANAASGGRFTLGIGLSPQIVIEGMFGFSFEKPARHMREYLAILLPLLRGEQISVSGETLTFRGNVQVPAEPCPVVIAALAPRMLALAGSQADGTITWMTGHATLADHIVPSITKAADEAGKPAPRVVCSLPVMVSDDPDEARRMAAETFAIYDQLPSYKAMLDREGAGGPADVAIVGDEDAVRAGINRMADAGCTEFVAAEFARSDDDRRRTRELLRSLL